MDQTPAIAPSQSSTASEPPAKPLRAVMSACWEATKSERLRFYAFVVLFILAYSIDLLTPWAIGYTLDVFVSKGFTEESMRLASYGVGAYTGLRLVSIILHHIARYLQITVAYSARMYTLNKLFGVLVDNPLNWHVRHHSGDSLSKLHRSAGAIESCIGTYVWQIIEGGVKIILAGIMIFTLDFWVAINVIAMSLVTIFVMIFFNRRLTNRIRRNNAFADKLHRICVDNFFNIVTVKTLALEDKAKHQLGRQNAEGLRNVAEIARYGELKWGTTGIGYSIVIGSSLMIYFYHRIWAGSAFDVAPVYVLMNYLDRIFQAIGSFTGYYSGVIEATTAYEDATRILGESHKIKADGKIVEPPQPWKRLAIRRLNYSYGVGESSGLHDVDLEIEQGDKIAVVGPSGSGKSTFLKIMGGLLEPDSCQIESDRESQISPAAIARSVLLIPQEPEIFAETFRYNLTMDEDFTMDELEQFIELTRLGGVLDRLQHNWETNLASKGLNLSVGEKQRLALARGLLRARSREIILLDEPTSSLDPATEKEIFSRLLKHFKSRTVITACHRLKIVPLFDRIIYVRAGRVVEDGTFQDLVKDGGHFAAAWEDYEKGVVHDGMHL